MARRLRVFISSPGDVRDAREVAAQTIESLSQEYRRHFELEPYLWESEAPIASGHFQDSIEPPSAFDIVALILWSRLGTLMPEQTSVRRYVGIDGRAPVTGTEWEFEDALRAAQQFGRPDILVYRSSKPAAVDAWDAVRRDEALAQLDALKRFWARHFEDQGRFISAYATFRDLDEFAFSFDSHLRRLLDRRVRADHGRGAEGRARLWTKSPFRGLEAFEFDDAPIYFGRSEAVGKALGQLIDNAVAGRAFLLVLGASGSGKSSLVRAGLAPRLSLPRRVTGRAFPRRALFRPGLTAADGDVFDALARCIGTASGDGVGLPEVGSVEKLADVMREAPMQAQHFLAMALDRVAELARPEGLMLQSEEASLLLVVDQLEELFTSQRIPADHRRRFAALLKGLAQGGRIWIAATMRSDFWHRTSETPDLVDLAQGFGRFDVLLPRPAEIAQMIRLPAEAAGLEFELDHEAGVSLDQKIAEEAFEGPGVLPLLSYVLDQLYMTDVMEGDGAKLTFETYASLGGLKGAIAERAEQTYNDQHAEVREALRQVIFALVQLNFDDSGGVSVSARNAPLAAFRSAARALVDAFLEPRSRLMVAGQDASGAATVRVCHEALFKEWQRAQTCITEDLSYLATRRRVEERLSRWSANNQRRDVLDRLVGGQTGLLTDVDLADAIRLAEAYRDQLSPQVADYIDRSRRVGNSRRRFGIAVLGTTAAVMTWLAAAASGLAFVAWQQARAAEVQLTDRNLLDSQVDGDAFMKSGSYSSAIVQYGSSVQAAEKLVRMQGSNPQWLVNLATEYARLAYAFLKRDGPGDRLRAHDGFLAAAQAAHRASLIDATAPHVRADRIKFQAQLAPFLNGSPP